MAQKKDNFLGVFPPLCSARDTPEGSGISQVPSNGVPKRHQMAPYISTPADMRSKEQEQGAGDELALKSLDAIMSQHTCLGTDNEMACSLLDFLHIHHCAILNVFVCFQHGTLLPRDQMVPHLHRRHQFHHTQKKLSVLIQMVDHILLLLTQSDRDELCASVDDVNLPDALETPIKVSSAVKSIRVRFQCPSCQAWVARNESYKGSPEAEFFRHLDMAHGIKQHPVSVIGKWCQKIGRAHV